MKGLLKLYKLNDYFYIIVARGCAGHNLMLEILRKSIDIMKLNERYFFRIFEAKISSDNCSSSN